ncbi:maleylacetoacetate isomerase [Ideonella sp. B508-1]|uniref:maleylacetoacetate isomerase n=1 Tax=Ideonella sp. B508-1 TaxID=137716 RepID=UPI000348E648|nr:maleylacetoacetate isomerase [Ideonella sp. B508-1]
MILYSFFNSSTAYRVRIALALKGLQFELRPVNIRRGEQYAPEHRAMSPVGGVPVLVDDAGNVLSQSLAILGYLDSLAPEPLLFPTEPLARARVQEFVQLIACDIHPVNNLRVLKYLKDTLAVDEVAKHAWYAHWVAEGLGAAEVLLQRAGAAGPFAFGTTVSAADVCLVPQVANALRMQCDLSAYPRLMAVHAHCQSLPAFRDAAPERQPDYTAP